MKRHVAGLQTNVLSSYLSALTYSYVHSINLVLY